MVIASWILILIRVLYILLFFFHVSIGTFSLLSCGLFCSILFLIPNSVLYKKAIRTWISDKSYNTVSWHLRLIIKLEKSLDSCMISPYFFNFRDFMFVGVLVVLDAHPEGIIYRDLIHEYVSIARTLYEGVTIVFVLQNYLYLCIKFLGKNMRP